MNDKRILPLVLEPNVLLHQKSLLVTKIDSDIKEFAQNLVATMKHHNGLGLAAVQTGILKRIIAIDVRDSKIQGDSPLNIKKGPMVLINPEIIEQSDEKKTYVEGCLSFGNIYPEVERANRIKVRYIDLNEKENFLEVSNNIMVSCIQHEIDHINGIVFLDRLSRIKKDFMLKKYLKWRKFNKVDEN